MDKPETLLNLSCKCLHSINSNGDQTKQTQSGLVELSTHYGETLRFDCSRDLYLFP